MKVILQQDIKGQGKKGELINVSDGYARNYLLPRKLAVAATEDNLNVIKQREKAKKALEEKERREAAEAVERLKSCVVKVRARAGSNGRLFGAVTSKEISEALKEQFGLDVGKNKIVQTEPIKQFGSYEVKCRLGFETTGTIYVQVIEEQ